MLYDVPDTADENPAPGDLCPAGLDRSLFTGDQLVYLDELFQEYDREALRRVNRLLTLAVPGVHSLHRTRVINLTVLDHLAGTYRGADAISGRELGRICRLNANAWSAQVARMRELLRRMSRARHGR